MAIQNFAEYFGCEAADIFEEKQQGEGYIAGVGFANKIHDLIIEEHGDRSAAFREGILRALREHL